MLGTILMCFAFVFAVFAAAGWPQLGRVHFGWLAIALLIGGMLFAGPVGALFR